MAQEVLYSVADGVATITLNRPERLNALNGPMYHGLIEAFDQTDRDDKVRAVVVTGAGPRFLRRRRPERRCPKLRLRPGRHRPRGAPRPRRHAGAGIFRSLKPVIAAINGPAVGVGITMTLPMDIRIMADSARVGFVFARRGIVPDGVSSWFLPRIVGISQALEWCLTGRAQLRRGASRRRGPHGLPVAEVLPLATRLAAEIAASAAPVSAVLTRHLLWQMLGADHPMVTHRIDSQAIYDLVRHGGLGRGGRRVS